MPSSIRASRLTPCLAPRPLLRRAGERGGYAMLIALVLIAVLTIIGATTLSVAGVDQRIAMHNQRHMVIMNAADAGTQHARYQLEHEMPADEGWDTADTGFYIPSINAGGAGVDDAETMFVGTEFAMNQGTYQVNAVYVKCSGPPPGYSTEQGRQSFRSDYWDMQSHGWFRPQAASGMAGDAANPIQGTVASTIRKVVQGPCKIR